MAPISYGSFPSPPGGNLRGAPHHLPSARHPHRPARRRVQRRLEVGRDPALTRRNRSPGGPLGTCRLSPLRGVAERPRSCNTDFTKSVDRCGPDDSNSVVAHMLRSASRLILVLIAAAAIAISAGGFSWDDGGNAANSGSGTSDPAVVDGSSAGSSGSATVNGFSWDDGAASSAVVAP
jgi:hypothetical protein